MRVPSVAAVVAVLSIATAAAAQPGQTPVAPQPPIPPPYTYQPAPPPPPVLTQEEVDLLADGEITDGQHIGGGVASLFLGFGIGQAIQGRWSDKGWIFTVGDTAAYGLIIYGLSQNDCWIRIWGSCDNDNDGVAAVVAGLAVGAVFRVWEIIDAWAAPPAHNRRLHLLQMRLGGARPYAGWKPIVVPTVDGDGAVAGVTVRF